MTEPDIRRRTIELRADDTEEGIVRGYVTTFDDPYDIGWGGVREVIQRSTFNLDRAIPLFYEHDWSAGPIGVSRSLRADAKGVLAEFELFLDEPRARNIHRAMKAKALREFSIGFLASKIERSMDEKLETITEGELLEVSSVVKGANPNTETVSVRTVPAAAPVAAAPGVVDPAAAVVEEDAPTKATLLAEVARVVEMADGLGMAEQLPQIVKNYLKIFAADEPAPQAPAADPTAVAPAAAPPARSAATSGALFEALRGFRLGA